MYYGHVLHATNKPPNSVGGKISHGTKALAVEGEPTKLYIQLNRYDYTDNSSKLEWSQTSHM